MMAVGREEPDDVLSPNLPIRKRNGSFGDMGRYVLSANC